MDLETNSDVKGPACSPVIPVTGNPTTGELHEVVIVGTAHVS